jgi:hypothetical protein
MPAGFVLASRVRPFNANATTADPQAVEYRHSVQEEVGTTSKAALSGVRPAMDPGAPRYERGWGGLAQTSRPALTAG